MSTQKPTMFIAEIKLASNLGLENLSSVWVLQFFQVKAKFRLIKTRPWSLPLLAPVYYLALPLLMLNLKRLGIRINSISLWTKSSESAKLQFLITYGNRGN